MSAELDTRSADYKALAEAFYLPDKTMFGNLRDQLCELPVSTALRESLYRGLEETPCDEELLRDYARLFVGPFELEAPPYGSLYLEEPDRVCGLSTHEVEEFYKSHGLQLTLKEPADHVSAELEFMSFLIAEQESAVGSGDEERAADLLEAQRYFFSRYVSLWMSAFAAKIIEHAGTKFYQSLGAATLRHIQNENELYQLVRR